MQAFSGAIAARRREMVHVALLVALDSLTMVLAFEIGRLVRASSERPFAHVISAERFAIVMLATVPFWVVIFALCGLYRVKVHGGRVSEVGRVFAAVCGGVMLLISLDYFSFSAAIFPSRSVPIFALIFGIPLVVLERQLVRGVMRGLFRRGRGLHNVLLIGTGGVASRIATELSAKSSGSRLVALISREYDGASAMGGVPIYPTVERAVAAKAGTRIHEIIQADVEMPPSEAARLMTYANAAGIAYRFVPDRHDVYAAASRMDTIDGVPVMEVRLTSLDGWGAVGKRAFDVVGALTLIAVFSPLMLAIALAVKITEPGAPVFYKQSRIGHGGKQIKVFKFRSMRWKYSTGPDRTYKTAEEAFVAMGREDLIPQFRQNHKVDNDPRVSKLGAFLRKTSLDELPQFCNALTGELSLVGPRPITQDELERYGVQATSFLALKPGITGLWQVYGRSNTTYEERVKLDIYYVENWSIGMDVSILVRTLVSVAGGRGAV